MSIQAEGYRNLDKAANDSDQELPDVIHEVKNKKETPYKEMDILTEVITSESIDEIFCSPEDYVDSYYDRALIKIWADGK